jgi:hypothetical protein
LALLTPYVLDALSTDADAFRRFADFLAWGVSGVRGDADLKVSAPGGMVSRVAAGQAIVKGSENATTQGTYHVTNDANVDLTHAAADGTNPRRDLIVLKIRDAFYSGANKDAQLLIVQGTPAGSPVDPSLASHPNNITLARVLIPAGSSSVTGGNQTDLRPKLGHPYKMRAKHTSAQSISTSVNTKVTLATEDYDPNANFDNASQYRYIAPISGYYHIIGKVGWSTVQATHTYFTFLYKNGSEIARAVVQSVGSAVLSSPVSDIVYLNATDYIELYCNTDGSGVSISGSASDNSYLAIHLLSL